jgi:hypothetical protein
MPIIEDDDDAADAFQPPRKAEFFHILSVLGFGEWTLKDARMFRLLRVKIAKTAGGKDRFESAFYCLTDDADKPPVLQQRLPSHQFGRPPASNKGTVELREKARQEIFARSSNDLKEYDEKSDADVEALWVAFKVKTDEHLHHIQLATLPDTFFVAAAQPKKRPYTKKAPQLAVAEVLEVLDPLRAAAEKIAVEKIAAEMGALEKQVLQLKEKVDVTEVACTS